MAFDAAASGYGALLMVVGEPGIGKTALTEHLASYVAAKGGRALVGHSYEEGSHSLPYLSFVEALRPYVLSRESDGLRASRRRQSSRFDAVRRGSRSCAVNTDGERKRTRTSS